jgi:hypothetical protein
MVIHGFGLMGDVLDDRDASHERWSLEHSRYR